MNISKIFFWAVFVAVSLTAGCSKESSDKDVPPVTDAGYSKGIFIINEGPFQSGTGTITYLTRVAGEKKDKLYQEANNGVVLGNIVQSMNYDPHYSENAFIAVNNANKIEVVNMKTFKRVQSVENISSPRHLEFGGDGKMYVSCWDNTVKIFSTVGLEFFGQVTAGEGPEKMLNVGSAIWVLNQGGFSVDSTVTIISTETDQVIHTLLVYPRPTGIQLDENGLVWILCSGKGWNGFPSPADSEAHLLCIDPSNYLIVKDLAFPNSSGHPEKLVINREKDQLFYNHVDGIYRFDTHGVDLDGTPFIPRGAMFYGLGFDPEENYIYASDPLDYTQNGMVFRFKAGSGEPVDSVMAGIIPGEFFFAKLVVE